MPDIFIFAILFVIIFLLAFLINKSKNIKDQNFDERQLILRSNAYNHAFFAVILYGAGYGMLTAVLEKHFMEDGMATLVGVFIGVVVFCVECVMKDVFFSVSDKPAVYLLLVGACTIINGIGSLEKIRSKVIIKNGILTIDFLQPACTITLLIILIAIIIKLLWLRQEEE